MKRTLVKEVMQKPCMSKTQSERSFQFDGDQIKQTLQLAVLAGDSGQVGKGKVPTPSVSPVLSLRLPECRGPSPPSAALACSTLPAILQRPLCPNSHLLRCPPNELVLVLAFSSWRQASEYRNCLPCLFPALPQALWDQAPFSIRGLCLLYIIMMMICVCFISFSPF